jgi:hypothetical protein
LVLLTESKPGYPDWIQVQIPPHLVQTGLVEDQHRLEPVLEHVTPVTMGPVDLPHCPFQRRHGDAAIGWGWVVTGVRVGGCAHAMGQHRDIGFGVGSESKRARQVYVTCGEERVPAEAQRRWEGGTWFPSLPLL